MVYHGWNNKIYITTSKDGIDWDVPQSIISSALGGKAWYPTIIGETDVKAGEKAKIYYADFLSNGGRVFKVREIKFLKPGQ